MLIANISGRHSTGRVAARFLRNIAARISLIISLLTTWAARAAMFFFVMGSASIWVKIPVPFYVTIE